MKKAIFILVTSFFATIQSLAQHDASIGLPGINGKNNTVSFGANIPVAEFSATHIAGISLTYSWSHHRYGKLNELPGKLIGLAANGGINYYFGKNETVAGYEYKYGGYLYLHAFGGIIYNPLKKENITLTAGPAIGIYKGGSDPGFGASLNGSHYITEKIAVSPGVMYMKHVQANALWAVMLKGTYNF